jgi:hypothetical protein
MTTGANICASPRQTWTKLRLYKTFSIIDVKHLIVWRSRWSHVFLSAHPSVSGQRSFLSDPIDHDRRVYQARVASASFATNRTTIQTQRLQTIMPFSEDYTHYRCRSSSDHGSPRRRYYVSHGRPWFACLHRPSKSTLFCPV